MIQRKVKILNKYSFFFLFFFLELKRDEYFKEARF